MDRATLQDWFNEIQETLMILGALILWGGFEYLVMTNKVEPSALPNIGITRTALITIVTNLFTFKFTKSLPPGGKRNEQ